MCTRIHEQSIADNALQADKIVTLQACALSALKGFLAYNTALLSKPVLEPIVNYLNQILKVVTTLDQNVGFQVKMEVKTCQDREK